MCLAVFLFRSARLLILFNYFKLGLEGAVLKNRGVNVPAQDIKMSLFP